MNEVRNVRFLRLNEIERDKRIAMRWGVLAALVLVIYLAVQFARLWLYVPV